jgi:hypothetical protein
LLASRTRLGGDARLVSSSSPCVSTERFRAGGDCRTGRVSSSAESGAVTVGMAGTAGAAGFGGAFGVCDGLGVKKLEIVCCLLLCDSPCEDWLLLGAMATIRGVDGKVRLARVVTRETIATRSRSHVGRHFRRNTNSCTPAPHHHPIAFGQP